MNKEIENIQPDIRHEVGKAILNNLNKYLGQGLEETVSQAQTEAFLKAVEALPEGKFKKLVSKLEGFQRFTAKTNEIVYSIQDHSWKIFKPLVVWNAPLAVAIPDRPFSKLIVKASKLGGKLTENTIKVSVQGIEKIKQKLNKKKGSTPSISE